MTELTPEEQIVLLNVHEYSPLWEIVADLRDHSEGTDEAHLRAKAVSILRDFANRGWLEIYGEPVPSDHPYRDRVPVSTSELEHILGDDRNWLIPRDRNESAFDIYIFDTTPAADEQIRAGALDDIWPGGVEREPPS
jgi:hypothetical protein